jgi:hypothetical protein
MNWTEKDYKNHLRKKVKPTTLFPQDNPWVNPHMDEYNVLVELLKENRAIYIQGNVPSLKNGKQIFQMNTGKSICCNAPYTKLAVKQYKCTKCGVVASVLGKRATLVPSAAHKKYTEEHKMDYVKNTKNFIQMIEGLHRPLYVGMYFIRSSERGWDIDNAFSTVMDLMRHNDWINDDTADIMYPVALGHHVDKKDQGVIITVTNDKPSFNYNNIKSYDDKNSNDSAYDNGVNNNPLDEI